MHHDLVLPPFRRPRRVVGQPLAGLAGQAVVVVDCVVTELVDVGVALVGSALAVTVHVDAAEARREDRVLAHRVDLIQDGAVARERRLPHVDRIVDHRPHEIRGDERARRLHDLDVSEREDEAETLRQTNRRRVLEVAREIESVGRHRHAEICGVDRPRETLAADGRARIGVRDMADRVGELTDDDLIRTRRHTAEGEPADAVLAEVPEPRAHGDGIRLGHDELVVGVRIRRRRCDRRAHEAKSADKRELHFVFRVRIIPYLMKPTQPANWHSLT